MKRLLLLLILAGCGTTAGAQALTAEQAWIRSGPPGAAMLAGYARLSNPGKTDLHIVEARSTAFASVEIHQTTIEDGVSRMRPVTDLVIPAGATVELAPGGMHLMLMQPKQRLLLGATVVVDLLTAEGDALPTAFNLRDVAPQPPAN